MKSLHVLLLLALATMVFSIPSQAAITNIQMNVDIAGNVIFDWDGGTADVYIQDNDYNCDFSKASVIQDVSSGWSDSSAGAIEKRFYRFTNADGAFPQDNTYGKNDIYLAQGYNLVALPFMESLPPNASNIASEIQAQGGVVGEMAKWDPLTGQWIVYDPSFPLFDFSVSPGESFLIQMLGNFTWTSYGMTLRAEELEIRFLFGISQIGIPANEFSTASELATHVNGLGGSINSLSWWDPSTGGWITHDPGFPLFDFNISPEVGIFVDNSASFFWDMVTDETCTYPSPDPFGGTGGGPILGSLQVTVVDGKTGSPISGAYVQVGEAPGIPFASNFGTTNGSGEIAFAHLDLYGPLTITAGQPPFETSDYAFFSLADVNSREVVIGLKPKQRDWTLEATGTVSGIDTSNFDLQIDAGLVVANPQSYSQLSRIVMDDLLMEDVLRSIPTISDPEEVPGNIYAPSQSIPFVGSLEFSPYEHLLFPTSETFDVTCVSGRASALDIIDIINEGGTIGDVIPLLDLREAGINRGLNYSSNATINVSQSVSYSGTTTVNIANTVTGAEVLVTTWAYLTEANGIRSFSPMGIHFLTGGPGSQSTAPESISSSGAFSGYTKVATATVTDSVSSSVITQIDRSVSGSATLNSFFDPIATMTQSGIDISFNSPVNSVSPSLDLQKTGIFLRDFDSNERQFLWDVWGDDTDFSLPEIDTSAFSTAGRTTPLINPGTTPENDFLYWDVQAMALPGASEFDFNLFDEYEIEDKVTHSVTNEHYLTYVE